MQRNYKYCNNSFNILVPGAVLPEPTKSTDNVEKTSAKDVTVPATTATNNISG